MSEMTAINLNPEKLQWRNVVEKSDLDGSRENLGFLKNQREGERKVLTLFQTRCFECWSYAFDNIVLHNLELPRNDANEVREYPTDEFQCNFPWKQRALFFFFKPFKKQGGKGDRNCTSLLLIWWTLNFPKHDSPRQDTEEFCKTRIWWNQDHPSRWPLWEEKQKQSSLPYCEATSCLQNTTIPSLLVLFLPLFNLYSSRWRKKTPLEIVNKPATHTKIKQKGNLNNTSKPPWVHYQV